MRAAAVTSRSLALVTSGLSISTPRTTRGDDAGCCHAGVEQAADGIGRIGSFLAPAVVGYMLYYGAGHYVLHTFALTYLIAAIAVFLVGIETKGRVLEQITAAKPA
jgi:hypothetical protein